MTQGFFIPFSAIVARWWNGLSEQEKNSKLKMPKVRAAAPEISETNKDKSYDLNDHFQKINLKYFDNKLELIELRWAKKFAPRKRSVTYGYYEKHKNRITINPILKENFIPFEVFEYVLFHEMLHIICEGYYIKRGRKRVFCIHTPEFKTRERQFPHYKFARSWLRSNIHFILKFSSDPILTETVNRETGAMIP